MSKLVDGDISCKEAEESYHDLAADICSIPGVVDFTDEYGSPVYGGNSNGKFVVSLRKFTKETISKLHQTLNTYGLRKDQVKIQVG